MPYLRHYANGASVGAVELVDDLSIGRSNDNAIVLDDGTVSACHAKVCKRDDQFVMVDCDSTNGIQFNGKKVKEHIFSENDVVTIGTHDFEFVHSLPQEFEQTLKIKKSWIPGVYYTE